MGKNKKQKWEQEVEDILKKHYQGDELSEQLKRANELLNPSQEIEPPSGDIGEIIALVLRWASEELYPLAAVYASFQIGVAYERYQNADRA